MYDLYAVGQIVQLWEVSWWRYVNKIESIGLRKT